MDTSSPFSCHFDTNYSPLEDEISRIKKIIHSHQAIVDDIARQIQELEERRRLHSKVIEQHTALLSPIKRVPTDILSSIFFACSPHLPSARNGSISRRHPAVVLSHVCQQWRGVALKSPLLWSTLRLYRPIGPNLRRYTMRNQLAITEAASNLYKAELLQYERKLQAIVDATIAWIDRSANCPLDVAFSWDDFAFFRHDYNGILSSDDSAVYLPQPPCIAPTMVDLLISVASRWKRVSFDLSVASSDSALLRLLEIPVVQQLEVVRIALSLPDLYLERNRLLAVGLTARVNLMKAPCLRSLAVAKLWAPAFHLPASWIMLTDLYLGSMLPYPGENHRALSVNHTLTVLGACPNLVHCVVNLDTDGFSPTANAVPLPLGNTITLPRLMSLTIQGSFLPRGFASSFNLPSLRTLSVICQSCIPQNEDESGLVEFVRNFGELLTEIMFVHSELTDSALLYCLERLSNVTTLRMVDTGVIIHREWNPGAPPCRSALLTDSILAKLSPNLDGSDDGTPGVYYCPHLQNFSCRMTEVEFTEQALVNFIAGRRQQNIPSRLKRVVVKFNAAKRMDVRKELEDRGVDLEGFSAVIKYNQGLAAPVWPYDDTLEDLLPEDRMVARDFWMGPSVTDW